MSIAESEAQLREELAHYCRFAYHRRLVSGTGGNLSVRLNERHILITPSAVSLRECAAEDFITVDLDGHKVDGPAHFVPPKEVYLHTAVYEARADVAAISHLHPPSCIVFAVRNRQIPLVTITAEVRLGPTPVVPEAPSGSQQLANLVRDTVLACPEAKLILLERQGVLAIGASLRDTIDVADLGEDTARVAHQLALSSGIGERRVWDISVKDQPGMHIYPGDPPLEMAQVRAIAKGDAANLTQLSLGAHTGTHVDAPAHFIDGAPTLDQVALDRMVGEATVLDLRGRAAIDAAALRPHAIGRGDIVLFKTDNSTLWDRPGFQEGFTYLTRDAAEYLVEREVRTIGMDYLSIEQFGSRTFEVHKILLGRGVLIIEGLDLREISAGPYVLSCLPLNLQGVDGAPARAVLMR
ncbi:MAG: class II aldolase/adducin family protein [Candidatus Binatia bacterium]